MTVMTPLFIESKGYSSQDMRLLIQGIYGGIEQVLNDAFFRVTAAGGAQVSVSGGIAVLQGDDAAVQGMYQVNSDDSVLKTHSRDAINPKIDLVCLRVNDEGEGGPAGDNGVIDIVGGTPTPSADPTNPLHQPTVPDTAIPLAFVLVPTGSTAISNILDVRPIVHSIGIPTGICVPTFGATADPGFLLATGGDVSRSTFKRLFERIGTSCGAGNGSTTFGLPNGKGKNFYGLDVSQSEFDALGKTGGAKTVALTPAQTAQKEHEHHALAINAGGAPPSHISSGGKQHILGSTVGSGGTARAVPLTTAGTFNYGIGVSGVVGGEENGSAHPNLGPYQVCNWQIKA
jgi:microcystin-dependent protein